MAAGPGRELWREQEVAGCEMCSETEGFLIDWLVLKSSENSVDFGKRLWVQCPLLAGSVTLPGFAFLICKTGMK